jgi:uncharacterized protein YbjT (DUF2867 family)
MKIIVIGATGLIGAAGHEVVGIGRDIDSPRRGLPQARWLVLDIGKVTRPED